MKSFFLLFFILVFSGQSYIMLRTWQLLPAVPSVRITVVVLMATALILSILSVTHIIDACPMPVSRIAYEIGTSWLIIAIYLIIIFLTVDILRLSHIVSPTTFKSNLTQSVVLTISLTLIFFLAWYHYEHKKRVAINVSTTKVLNKPLRFVLVSDLHLGYHNTRKDLHRWLQLIKAEHPDAILIGGDLIDGSYRPVAVENMAEEFRHMDIPVFACLGNHDYYTGLDNDLRFCHRAGITVLRDSVASFEGITLIGRDDRTNPHRKSLHEIMAGVNPKSFLLELDHQPYHLEEAMNNGIDFEFAGHTHHGQVWPISWITDALYEKAFGAWQKGHTHYYISSGMGIWGAKFRIGTQSEYIVLSIINRK